MARITHHTVLQSFMQTLHSQPVQCIVATLNLTTAISGHLDTRHTHAVTYHNTHSCSDTDSFTHRLTHILTHGLTHGLTDTLTDTWPDPLHDTY